MLFALWLLVDLTGMDWIIWLQLDSSPGHGDGTEFVKNHQGGGDAFVIKQKQKVRREAMIQINEQKMPRASHVFILKSFNIYCM